jgi:DNA-binding transcriptional ArsR family regulator
MTQGDPLAAEACEVRMVHPDRVEAVKDGLVSPEDASRLAERFKLLAEPGRLRMVYALLEAGEMCVCDLAAAVEATESATSHQLRQLRLAGLVRSRKEGRTVYYRVDDTHVRLLLDVAVEHYLHGHDDRH